MPCTSSSPTGSSRNALVDHHLLARIRQVLLVNGDPHAWYVQRRYQPGGRNTWRPVGRPMTDADLGAMVTHRHWIACRAPADGTTDRLAFDLDAKGGKADRERQRALYRALRELLGPERIPLVVRTPSVYGLRVVYRIPRTPLSVVVTSPSTGLVADVCRGAGLPVQPGRLEIYPQRVQVDRLPLGRGMPLLDPETLEPLPHAAIDDRYDPALLGGALAEMERARVHHDLVAHLETLPARAPASPVPVSVNPSHLETSVAVPGRVSSPAHLDVRDAPTSADAGWPLSGGQGTVRTTSATRVAVEARRLVTEGLSAPSTRYWAEFQVGLAVLLEPTLFGLRGPIRGPHADHGVAEVIAGWLAERHNGHSREFAASLRRYGSVERARAAWLERYLRRDAATGLHMIDRLERMLAARTPTLRRTSLVAPAERDALMALAADAYGPGTQRYRAECWLVAWRRATRTILAYRARRQLPVTRTPPPAGAATAGSAHAPLSAGPVGPVGVELEICTAWMRRWPFGEGRSTHPVAAPADTDCGRHRYQEYRALLAAAGQMELAQAAPVPARFAKGASRGRELPHEAHRYRITLPDMAVRVCDVGVDDAALRAVRSTLPRQYGRLPSLDEAHHALALVRWGIDLRARYGQRTEAWVTTLTRAVEAGLARAT